MNLFISICISFLIFGFALFNSNIFSQTTITDESGNIYKTVKIGNQIWMAENLRTEKFNNGDPIDQVTSNPFWKKVTDFAYQDSTLETYYPVMSYYQNEKGKNNALYNWYVAHDIRGVCPQGWHLPLIEEFDELINFLGGFKNSGTAIKLKSSYSWIYNGKNISGFNALAIGSREVNGAFSGKGERASYWVAGVFDNRELSHLYGYYTGLSMFLDKEVYYVHSVLSQAHSIRCVKD